MNDEFRFASIWLTNEEKNNQEIRDEIFPLIEKWKSRKYKFVIYESGQRNLLEQTKGLLNHNKNLIRESGS